MKNIYHITESEIRSHWGQSGHWKQSIAMRLSYKLGSLKAAWSSINMIISQIRIENEANKQENSDNWVDLITDGLEERLGKRIKELSFE